MRCLPVQYGATNPRTAVRRYRIRDSCLNELGIITVVRRYMILASLNSKYERVVCLAKCACCTCDIIQGWLQIAWGTTDDIEDLTCCGLVFKGLQELAFTGLLGLEEPSVFDGDDSLVCKGFEQGNLTRCERKTSYL
jgi:hypothetical protein